jgi:hypothetical protein
VEEGRWREVVGEVQRFGKEYKGCGGIFIVSKVSTMIPVDNLC